MNRLFLLVTLFLLSLPCGNLLAQQFGQVAATFNIGPAKLLADPVRARVYATVPSANSVVVIDVNTLKIIAAIPIGSDPSGMAISTDNNRLYVANSGSTIAAIGVVDLNTLQALPSFSLPTSTHSLAAGSGNSLYAISYAFPNDYIYQLDGVTGAVQSTYSDYGSSDTLLAASPDRRTLFSADEGTSASRIDSYDVSTGAVVAHQSNYNAGGNGQELVISHNGLYLCFADGAGNGSGGYGTALFSTADITAYYGTFRTGAYPGPLAFSPDDSLVYQNQNFANTIKVFDTRTFNQVQSLSLSASSSGSSASVTDVEVDHTGAYLLVGQTSGFGSDASQNKLTVYLTGRGPQPAPVITSVKTVSAQTFRPFSYQIAATNNPTSYTAAGLPPGLSLDAASGVISGAPTTPGVYTATIGAVNASGEGDATLSLTVTTAPLMPPVINSVLSAAAQVGQPFSYQITATNSPTSFSAAPMPPGLSLDAASGLLSGVPLASGSYSVALSAQNAAGSGTQTLMLTIAAAAQSAPTIIIPPSINALAGQALYYQASVTGAPTSFTASGLPPGLYFNPVNGAISGTPAEVGDYPVALSAANAAGTTAATLVIHVLPAPLPTVAVAATEPVATTDGTQAGEFTISRTGSFANDLTVTYAIKGNAVAGVDYQALSGSKKIKAGKASARIRIVAMGSLGGAARKTLKLVLQPDDAYIVGDANQARVKIVAP